MKEERMYKYNPQKFQLRKQTTSHSVMMIFLFGCLSKVCGHDTHHNSLKCIFFFKSPASELRLPLVSGAPETDSNIRLDLINQDKMEVYSSYLRKEFP